MKILLAPSETKKTGGKIAPGTDKLPFAEIEKERKKLLELYRETVLKGDLKELEKLFGIKKEKDILSHRRDILESPRMKAIERYTGVAFDHLDYPNLTKDQQGYVDENTILFSNLFGPILASSPIPEYKLKQGESIRGEKPEKLYKTLSSKLLDSFLEGEDVLDLRAGFYDKFYVPSKPYTTMKFVKDGKVVSHWAKAYRGEVLRAAAENNAQSIEELLKLEIEGLKLEGTTTKGNKTEALYSIREKGKK